MKILKVIKTKNIKEYFMIFFILKSPNLNNIKSFNRKLVLINIFKIVIYKPLKIIIYLFINYSIFK
jgi:hypothetical protein